MSKEWDAAAYHRISDPQFAWGRRVLDRFTLEGTEDVLDAGCGSGRLTLELMRRLQRGRVVAVDLSENMTRMAAGVLGDVGGRGADRRWESVCADLVALPFRHRFDVVFSTATFHWIADHGRLFASLHQVLRAGGRLEAQCGGSGNLERTHAAARRLIASTPFRAYFEGWTDPWEFPDVATTERRLHDVGFPRATCWLEATPATFGTAEEYREFVEKVVMRPFLARLPTAEARGAFLDGIVEAGGRADPAYTLDYWRLNISARRD